MQIVSEKFKESIRNPRERRNLAYIKAYVGIINQIAQDNAQVDKEKCSLLYFANAKSPFDLIGKNKIYATYEKDFSRVDGSMYFPPREGNKNFYDNGIVSRDLLGDVYIYFGKEAGLDIKGLTIDFGEYYPTEFTIEYDGGTNTYTNNGSEWNTEDVFNGVSFFRIKPVHMVNVYGRLRILKFTCGLVKTFTNDNVIKCQMKEYVSPISETVSSQDLTLEVDNHNLYFDVDNGNSAITFMETGQEVRVIYGYDVDGKGTIEWIPAQKCYMSSWKATDTSVEFQAVDRLALLDEKYYKGIYREQGINLYDLAVDVLNDAGITDSREYYLDPYLKKVTVQNPMPPVTHKESLQIIANAGRCKLYQGRDGNIYLKNNIIPKKSISVNDIADFSKIESVFNPEKKQAYAMYSKDFSKVGGSVYFLPREPPYLSIGYVSKSLSDSGGNFKTNPKITIDLEAQISFYKLSINFRNTKPEIFSIRTYLRGTLIDNLTIREPEMECVVRNPFKEFDKMEIEFIKGYPEARVTVDNIIFGDYTDYHISNDFMYKQPERIKTPKVKDISIIMNNFSKNAKEKELLNSNMVLEKGQKEYVAYFSNPSYGYKASVDNPQIKCKVEDSSAYFVRLSFSGVNTETAVNLKITGHEYLIDEKKYTENHSQYGENVEWNNPLISTNVQAAELEKWLASYLLGSVDYNIDWWGDPTTDVGDLFYFSTQKGNEALIRSYENTLTFSGGWRGTMKARRVVFE